jgi:uncharacterized protein (TIGR02001 family)
MPIDLPPPRLGIELTLASHGMSKGIGQTDGPQAIARGMLKSGDFQAGVQWKNVNSSSAHGEASAFVSGSHKFGSLQLNAGIARKMLIGAPAGTDSTSWEFTAAGTRKFGPVSLRANAIFSPDDLGSARRSLFVEAAPAVQLAKGWTASAAIGHRDRESEPDYTAFNAGLSKSIRWLLLDVRYYDTNRSGIGEAYRARVVASAKVAF